MTHACISEFGAGSGLSWVGVCDAAENPNAAELVLTELIDGDGVAIPSGQWVNPCPAASPCTRQFECGENSDTPVAFDLTVLRRLPTGFVDAAIALGDIVCSARASCVVGGVPIRLPYEAIAGPQETMLLELDCAAGDDPNVAPRLMWSDIVLDCGGTQWIYPGWLAGGAIYADEPLQSVSMNAGYTAEFETQPVAGWRAQLALNRQFAAGCRVRATATAWPGAVPAGGIPAGQSWPIVEFDVPIAPATAFVACGASGLDDGSGKVFSRYVTGPFGFEAVFNGVRIVQLVSSGT
jgi:hypothetical protein